MGRRDFEISSRCEFLTIAKHVGQSISFIRSKKFHIINTRKLIIAAKLKTARATLLKLMRIEFSTLSELKMCFIQNIPNSLWRIFLFFICLKFKFSKNNNYNNADRNQTQIYQQINGWTDGFA